MARFTDVTLAEADRLCRELGVGAAEAIRALDAGTINSNFAVTCAGARWFLRVNEGKALADVRYEAEVVAELVARGVSTPLPRRTREGEWFARLGDKAVSLFPWLPGDHLCVAAVTAAAAARVGRELARLHLAGAGLGRLRRAGIYTTAHIAERHRGFAASTDPELTQAIPLIAEELDWLEGFAAERAAAPSGLIHGDLFRDNVLFDGERAWLLDFEQASWGSWVYDLAVTLNAWSFAGELEPERGRALLAGYAEVRPLAAAERALLAVELRAAATRFATTRITDVYLAASGVPGKDFRRYLARIHAWRAGGAAALGAPLR